MLKRVKDAAFFLHCIAPCRGASCQDPRDRVFALSSMNSADWPQPNYSATISEVYVRFTKGCVEHHCGETILYHAARQLKNREHWRKREDLMPGCPSWAVNWSEPEFLGTDLWLDYLELNRC